MSEKETVLQVKNLKTSFYTHIGEVQAVRGISFNIKKGDVLGIVGESGSGKSVTSLSVMGLIEEPGKIKEGSIIFDDIDITKLTNREMSKYRGNDIAMIFQDPMTSLNPVFKIKDQMTEFIQKHLKISKSEAFNRAVEMLDLVGIPEPETRINSYPHEFSGGMRQRVMIAMALSCNPKLLIADEPTTALDVTIQAQILDVMRDLAKKIDTAIILITHDLGVIAETCQDLVVMYGGMPMEQGTVLDVFENPQHPYTVGLLESIPKMQTGTRERLKPIPGSPPDLLKPPKGCPFSTRCRHAMQICLEKPAPMYGVDDKHTSACWLLDANAPSVEGYRKGRINE